MKDLKLNRSLSRAEMKFISGGKANVQEFQCWCDGIRNGYCDGATVACCGEPRCDGSTAGSKASLTIAP